MDSWSPVPPKPALQRPSLTPPCAGSNEDVRPVVNFPSRVVQNSLVSRRSSPLVPHPSHSRSRSADGDEPSPSHLRPILPHQLNRPRPKSSHSRVPSPLSTTVEVDESATYAPPLSPVAPSLLSGPETKDSGDVTSTVRRSKPSIRSILSLKRTRSSSSTTSGKSSKSVPSKDDIIPPVPRSPRTTPPITPAMDPSAVPFPSTPEKPRHSAIEATRNSLNRTSMSLSVSAKSRDPSLNWMTAQPSTTPKFSRNQLNAIPIIMPLSRTEVEERRKSIGPSSGIARSWQGSMKNGKRLSVEQLERTKSSRELTTMAPRLAVPADLKDQGRLSRSLTSVDQSSKVPVVRIVGPMPVDPAVERLREIGDLILGQSSLSLSMRSDSAGSISASTSSPSKSSSVSTLDFSLNSTRSSKTSLDTIPPRPAFHSSEVFTSGSPDGSSDNGSARSSLETPPLSPAHRMLMSTSAPSLTSTSVRTLVPAIAIDGVDVNAIAKPNAAMTNSLNVRHGTGSATSLSTLCPTAVRTTLSSSRISLPPGARPPENFRPNGRGVIVLGTIPLDSPMSGKPTKKKGWRRWFT